MHAGSVVCTKEEAVGVHMGITASMVIIDRPALFLSQKGAVFVRRKSECVSSCYTKTFHFRGASPMLCEHLWSHNHIITYCHRYFSFEGSDTCFHYLHCWFKLFPTQPLSCLAHFFSPKNKRKHQLSISWSYQYSGSFLVISFYVPWYWVGYNHPK